mmetsp:Transcript_1833/g.3770  ORF Transcript_1833/g.3770 Transcript_1833/m.3770 type:complete len:314 (-) Transcript_1833:22-963(-)|eukprot:CAMPEP_0173232796 /NCGR_PEP_ID=MMETSP1142-20121109/9203_1 /TAXON_ID=483371 /ORGANISM="non described non described, Strain CCMP2298" /LENGTH=313 /DNA_ID=CAMNT_0014162433 /DNA_START=21 /DNA_END=962 /DNA_ORIENTATION=+
MVAKRSLLQEVGHFPVAVKTLFVNKKFGLHRLGGVAFLFLWFAALYYFHSNYEWFLHSPLVWTLPLTGVYQSLSATYYFSFLPAKSNPGYYGDKGALSYEFVKENIFFATILLFQWLYYSPTFFPPIRRSITIEYLFVFFPYFFRSLVPKTSFRDALKDSKNATERNKLFYLVVTWVTKLFYIWAKHFIGFFLNYMRFLGRISPEHQYHVYYQLIWGSCATTLSMFLHTLKFKGYIGPRTAYLLYMTSYMMTFVSFYHIRLVFLTSPDLVLLCLGGIGVNFGPVWGQYAYQIFAACLLYAIREGLVEGWTAQS